jgi:hypothetical protein
MPFIELDKYEKSFSSERTALKNELESALGENPHALDKYPKPEDTRWGVGDIVKAALIAFGINLVLTLILAAAMDGIFPNYDTMPTSQKDTITHWLIASLGVLPVVTLVALIVKNIVVSAKLKSFKKLKTSPEYKKAVKIQAEYDAKEAANKKKMDEFEEKISPNAAMGIIYIDGGAPADNLYMGHIVIDGEENQMLINYRRTPYEIFVPRGTHDVEFKRRDVTIWKESFYCSPERVYTIDVAGASDSSELSENLDKYSISGRSDVRYQEITKLQYRKALAGTSREITSYVMK